MALRVLTTLLNVRLSGCVNSGSCRVRGQQAPTRRAISATALGAYAHPSTPMRRAELRLHSTGVPFNVMATFGQPCGQH